MNSLDQIGAHDYAVSLLARVHVVGLRVKE